MADQIIRDLNDSTQVAAKFISFHISLFLTLLKILKTLCLNQHDNFMNVLRYSDIFSIKEMEKKNFK